MTLQQQVQQHLQNTGISLRELSRRSGVSHNVVSRVLQGKRVRPINHNKLSRTVATARKTLDATVEKLAAQCIDSDLTHVRDTDLECAKYRRVMQLEAEVSVVREQRNKLGFACEELTADLETEKRNFAALEQVHEQREQHLKSCENALIEAHVRDTDLEYMKWLAGEDGRKLQDYQAQIGKAEAMILGLNESNECLQRQLDQSKAQFKSLQTAYNQQVDDEREMLAQIDTLFVERENAETLRDQQVMCLLVYVWSPICAVVLLIVSGLVVWGGV